MLFRSLQDSATAIASLDAVTSLAERADTLGWTQPELTERPELRIEGGRHPVVQRFITEAFVPNDVEFHDARRMLVVTGPNMGGKSTFLRQNALIAVLAQAGSFVPASSATLGLVDRLFSRVGASDNLARGRSTFMVEMVETAAILNRAGERALVILDEIGRGTATFDGLSIAWATIESLHETNR